MRLFVAADLPDELSGALAETQAALREAVRGRFVAPDSLHVTLAFLGEVEGWRLADAEEALETAVAQWRRNAGAATGAAAGGIACELGELGSFGRRGTATLWQAVRSGGALEALAASARCELRDCGFELDDKKFLAHVTLMRAADLTSGLLPAPATARGRIRTVTLFESDLSGTRPLYTPLCTIDLA